MISRPWRDFSLPSVFPALAALRAGLFSVAPSALVVNESWLVREQALRPTANFSITKLLNY
jgi:hypothetical protein